MVPDFLGIGAQKAGTTWLWSNLRQHPDLWLPPLKEIHFFDRSLRYPSPLMRRFYDGRWFRHLRRRAAERWEARTIAGLSWDVNYFLRRRDRGWYERVFAPGAGRRTGDITPAYSALSRAEVERVRAMVPEAQILFLMRDPLDRAWSGARMAARLRGLDLGDEARLARYFEAQRAGRGDYLRTLATWEACYPPERFFIGFFEDIVQDPAGFLTRVHAFLGVRSGPEFVPAGAGEKANESAEAELPEAPLRLLARLYLADLELLAARFGGWPASWLARARRVAADGAGAASVGAPPARHPLGAGGPPP